MIAEKINKPYSVLVSSSKILVNGYEQFAILDKRPNARGHQSIVFSVSLANEDAHIIRASGMAKVISFTSSGVLTFERLDLYDHTKMYELIIDILNRHEKKELHKHLA